MAKIHGKWCAVPWRQQCGEFPDRFFHRSNANSFRLIRLRCDCVPTPKHDASPVIRAVRRYAYRPAECNRSKRRRADIRHLVVNHGRIKAIRSGTIEIAPTVVHCLNKWWKRRGMKSLDWFARAKTTNSLVAGLERNAKIPSIEWRTDRAMDHRLALWSVRMTDVIHSHHNIAELNH